MIGLNIKFLKEGETYPAHDRQITDNIEAIVMPNVTAEGRPAVGLKITTNGGDAVIAVTTARLIVALGRAIMGRYPELMDDN